MRTDCTTYTLRGIELRQHYTSTLFYILTLYCETTFPIQLVNEFGLLATFTDRMIPVLNVCNTLRGIAHCIASLKTASKLQSPQRDAVTTYRFCHMAKANREHPNTKRCYVHGRFAASTLNQIERAIPTRIKQTVLLSRLV